MSNHFSCLSKAWSNVINAIKCNGIDDLTHCINNNKDFLVIAMETAKPIKFTITFSKLLFEHNKTIISTAFEN